MLGSALRYLDGPVAQIGHALLHSVDLVAEYQRVPDSGFRSPSLERNRALGLLDAQYAIPVGPQRGDGIGRIGEIRPRHGQFGPQRRLVNIARRRRGRNAAQAKPPDGKRVARTKKRSDVIHAAHVVEHDRNRTFRRGGIFFGGKPPQFVVGRFSHIRAFFTRKYSLY